uniref:PfkB domain-containing protein n=1 Tax=Thermotoga maritima (strain ATCC 43589 / DSM 3109 / JCM 10099 / NBRC 100826 / MSB8) TaxID=243274 RepID=UPI001B7F7970|nr:Chain A, PfkB domain-containing protein [Thermotoga maritima MSB8]7E4L_B Chain B, PfkB domain-containing protein [Thermotoga maritima MSB8]
MITFIGHVSKDVNVVDGKREIAYGGGVVMGAITSSLLGVKTKVITKCTREDVSKFSFLRDNGVEVVFLKSPRTTSIELRYGSDPDTRELFLISAADPFTESDLAFIEGEAVHINPLWYGEFPEDLIPVLRRKVMFLSADAQGFVRVPENEKLVYRDWEMKEKYLKYLDLFKVDSREAETLTGTNDLRESCRIIRSFGAKIILATHASGVIVFDGNFYEASFRSWSLEGRTGRGDTCTAAFLVGFVFKKMSIEKATKFAAAVTSVKMRHPGPLRREDLEAISGDQYF